MVQRAWGTRASRALARSCVVAYGLAFAVWAASGIGTADQREILSDIAPLPIGLAVAATAWLAGARAVEPSVTTAWRRIAAAFLLWWLGDAIWFTLEVGFDQQPFPSPADAAYLAFYPVLAWGVLAFRGPPRSRTERTKVCLDALTVLLAAGMVVWYLVVGPVVEGDPAGLATLLNVAYPVGDLLLVFVVTMTLMGRPGRTMLWWVLGGVSCFVLADLGYARLSLSDSYSGGDWPDVFWTAAQCVFLLGGLAQLRLSREPVAHTPESHGRPGVAMSHIPYSAIALGYALLIAVGRDEATYPLNGLLVGAAAITALVVVRQVRVMTDNVRLLEELHHLAEVDGLTSVLNRRTFIATGERLFRRGERLGRALTVLMIDVDHFKVVNDTFGHAAGDAVLVAVAARTKAELRQTDVVGRYGGDELAVLMPDCTLERGFQVAERIRRAVDSSPIATDDGIVSASLSIGVAEASAVGDIAAAFARADAGLYEAKRAGRGCTRVA